VVKNNNISNSENKNQDSNEFELRLKALLKKMWSQNNALFKVIKSYDKDGVDIDPLDDKESNSES